MEVINREIKAAICATEAKYSRRMSIKINELAKHESKIESKFCLYCIPWKIRFYKTKNGDKNVLISCADFPIKLLPSNPNEEPIRHHEDPYVLDSYHDARGRVIINWDDLIEANDRYVDNGTIILAIEVVVETPKDKHR